MRDRLAVSVFVFFYFFLHLCIYRYVCVKLSFASSARRSMLLDRPICETGRLLETLIQFQNRVGQTQPPTEEKQNLSVRYCHSSQDSFSSKLIILNQDGAPFKCMLHWWKLMWRQEENSVLYRSEKRMCDLWKESWLYFKAQECLEKNFFVFLFLIWRGWCSGWWLMTWWWLAWRSRILRENKSTFEFKAAHFASTLLERPRI